MNQKKDLKFLLKCPTYILYIHIYMFIFIHYIINIPYIHKCSFQRFCSLTTHPAADLVPWHHLFLHHCEECLAGADIVVQVGDEVTKDEPLTTNPNVGGFGQAGLSQANKDLGWKLHGWEEKWRNGSGERWCFFLFFGGVFFLGRQGMWIRGFLQLFTVIQVDFWWRRWLLHD